MNNPFNEQSLQLYIGEKRSGKTLGMTADIYEMIKNHNVNVFANYELNKKFFPTFKRIRKNDLENFYKSKDEFKKCIFLIDEIHIFLDSRKFMNKGNQKIGYFLGQMGKRGNILIGNTHFPRLVDFRFRAYCEKSVYITKVLVRNNEILPILNYNKELTEKEDNQLYIYCEPIIRKLVNYDFEYTPLEPYLIKANKYFNYYDTEELITPE